MSLPYDFFKDMFLLLVKWYKNNKLSKEEKEILIYALKKEGYIYLEITEDEGETLFPISHSYDTSINKIYIEALYRLPEKGYITKINDNFFKLTNKGVKKAVKLKSGIAKIYK